MRIYDIVLVLRSSLSDDKRKKLVDTITGWVKDLKIEKKDDIGQKPLSYPIKKEVSGHYVMLTLQGEAAIPTDFEKRLLTQADVLRHLVIRKK